MRIGFFVTASKYHKLEWPDFDKIPIPDGITSLTLISDLEELGEIHANLDVLIFKVTELLAAESTRDASSIRKLEHLQAFLAAHPKIVQLDPVPFQRNLGKRGFIASILKRLDGMLPPEFQVHSPETAVVSTKDQIASALASISFPAICKKEVACGTAISHIMSVVLTPDTVLNMQPPFILQEYVNHNSVITKVFVVGSRVFTQQRQSLPNLAQIKEKPASPLVPFEFDNQRPVAPQVANWMSSNQGQYILSDYPGTPTLLCFIYKFSKHVNNVHTDS